MGTTAMIYMLVTVFLFSCNARSHPQQRISFWSSVLMENNSWKIDVHRLSLDTVPVVSRWVCLEQNSIRDFHVLGILFPALTKKCIFFTTNSNLIGDDAIVVYIRTWSTSLSDKDKGVQKDDKDYERERNSFEGSEGHFEEKGRPSNADNSYDEVDERKSKDHKGSSKSEGQRNSDDTYRNEVWGRSFGEGQRTKAFAENISEDKRDIHVDYGGNLGGDIKSNVHTKSSSENKRKNNVVNRRLLKDERKIKAPTERIPEDRRQNDVMHGRRKSHAAYARILQDIRNKDGVKVPLVDGWKMNEDHEKENKDEIGHTEILGQNYAETGKIKHEKRFEDDAKGKHHAKHGDETNNMEILGQNYADTRVGLKGKISGDTLSSVDERHLKDKITWGEFFKDDVDNFEVFGDVFEDTESGEKVY